MGKTVFFPIRTSRLANNIYLLSRPCTVLVQPMTSSVTEFEKPLETARIPSSKGTGN